ncbi:MAG: UvrB/UvrC motif-containing protein [Phycisphaerales bacterium]|nr:UvrB/UvrC motif-containing protein [Phycisphaerales bacterium]
MVLDLADLIGDWKCDDEELAARVVSGRDGQSLIQLRIELGLLQMLPDGRPDGKRYHGMPTAADYVNHELKVNRRPTVQDWRELARELGQFNYRRLAFCGLAERTLSANSVASAQLHLARAVRDTDFCLGAMRLANRGPVPPQLDPRLEPALLFDRARLMSQLRLVEGMYDEAVEEAETGAAALTEYLRESASDDIDPASDSGVTYLLDLGRRLRKQYDIEQTLRERLDEAIDQDDYEAAARLRDELRRRKSSPPDRRLPPPQADDGPARD